MLLKSLKGQFSYKGPVLIASSEGGVNIEEVAEKNPDAIVKFPIDIHEGLTDSKAKDVAKQLGFPSNRHEEVAQIFVNLYNLFVSKDATMVEINPFAEDSNGDCKKSTWKMGTFNKIFPL